MTGRGAAEFAATKKAVVAPRQTMAEDAEVCGASMLTELWDSRAPAEQPS